MTTPAKYPPQGFTVIRPVPLLWTPYPGDTIRGYVCDPRPDCVGILLTERVIHVPGVEAKLVRSPLDEQSTIGEVVHVEGPDDMLAALRSLLVEIEEDGSKMLATMEVCLLSAIVNNRWTFAIAADLTPDKQGRVAVTPMAEAYARAKALREAQAAPSTPVEVVQPTETKAETPAPAPAVPNGSTP